MSDEGLQRLDAIRLGDRRERSNTGGFLGFNPGLPQRPCEALAPDVGKFDVRIAIGLAEDRAAGNNLTPHHRLRRAFALPLYTLALLLSFASDMVGSLAAMIAGGITGP
jgi:hypothetical protein